MHKYKLLPEHEARFPEWRDRWIANAMSTEAMTDEDRAACVEAVHGMYAAAKLPPPKHVVFVPSPFVLAFASGFAAARWQMFKGAATIDATWAATEAATSDATWAATEAATSDATIAATRAATSDATRDATRAATWAATSDATIAATEAATWAATSDATRAATWAATSDATWAATSDATIAATWAATSDATSDATRDATDYSRWYVVPGDMRAVADALGVGGFGLQCAANAWRMWSGGNQWSGYDAYLSFFQDVAGIPLDYSAYNHWRTLAERSGPRIVHPDFCMISDRPAVLKVDAQNRPHCEDGPFCEWRDGSQLYSWHGARIPARWIRDKATIDPTEILREPNVELRAAGAACIGWPRMLSALDYRIIDADPDPSHGELIELRLEGLPKPGRFLKAECPRNGSIVEGVPGEIKTVHEAQAWRVGLTPSEFKYPEVRT